MNFSLNVFPIVSLCDSFSAFFFFIPNGVSITGQDFGKGTCLSLPRWTNYNLVTET